MITDAPINKTINPTVMKIFIRGKKLNISVVFIIQYYFIAPKNIRLNYNIKIPNKRKLLKIVFNHRSDNDSNGFMNLYKKKSTAKPYSVLVTDTTLASDNKFYRESF